MRRLRLNTILAASASLGVITVAIGLVWPNPTGIPVRGATTADWNHETFWYHPWGRSIVHKGIDIFASRGQAVISASTGIVVFAGQNSLGGNVVSILGPRWRLHYYAHLDSLSTHQGEIVRQGQAIGFVGNSGNARGKPCHLHYSIVTLVPQFWRIDGSPRGWLKMFFLDPGRVLSAASQASTEASHPEATSS